MSRELFTPVDQSLAVIDLANKRFRKQILPLTEIDYKGRKIKFDRAYLADLANAFTAGSFDQIPFQLADAANTHTNDPERFRGEMVGVELTDDGLDGVFELSDEGAAVVKANPRLGVSARIIENYDRSDGKKFPRAIQHVLGTLDPRVPGMRPWQEVTLSNEQVTESVDLSGETVGEENIMPETTSKLVTVELSEDDHAALIQLLADQKLAANLANESTEDETEEAPAADEPAEDETEEAPAADEPAEEEAHVGLSREQAAAVELASATAATAHSQVVELTNKLRAAEVQREIDRFRNAGLAPAIIEAARPALELAPQAIELANGTTVDPGTVIREVLTTVMELARTGQDMIDLDVETGVLIASDSVQEQRSAAVAAMREAFGN